MLNKIEANNLLIKKILSGEPLMAARFGATEIKAVLYPSFPKILKFFLKKRILNRMFTLSGFFPSTEENIIKFSNLTMGDIKNLDILGSWRIEEFFFKKELKDIDIIKLNSLEPYFFDEPWSKALANKKVLVIHPFAETIIEQYKKKDFLFLNKNVLPNFELDVIKAVQSLSGEKNQFNDWFEALDFMKNQISNKNFDIALIGCGAYGFPLAAHIKRMGKQAIHIGGSLQILFGIKGKRWDDHPIIGNLYNEHWVRPLVKDKPVHSNLVENDCYW
tara:strand:+ start:106 stop:930 length:825 start_codon:yes stop_codon:yes gene_type:complete